MASELKAGILLNKSMYNNNYHYGICMQCIQAEDCLGVEGKLSADSYIAIIAYGFDVTIHFVQLPRVPAHLVNKTLVTSGIRSEYNTYYSVQCHATMLAVILCFLCTIFHAGICFKRDSGNSGRS